MSLEQEQLIQTIAVKHGITIGRDDPILILQTLNAQLMAENTQQQQQLLAHYQQNLEILASRWGNDANERAEHILNAALAASKEVMQHVLQDSAKTTAQRMKQAVADSLVPLEQILVQNKSIAKLNLLASVLTGLAAGSIIMALFFK